MRNCHNNRCGSRFQPRRRDQKHCDTLCKERCLPCRRKYNTRNAARMRELRKSRRGLAA